MHKGLVSGPEYRLTRCKAYSAYPCEIVIVCGNLQSSHEINYNLKPHLVANKVLECNVFLNCSQYQVMDSLSLKMLSPTKSLLFVACLCWLNGLVSCQGEHVFVLLVLYACAPCVSWSLHSCQYFVHL